MWEGPSDTHPLTFRSASGRRAASFSVLMSCDLQRAISTWGGAPVMHVAQSGVLECAECLCRLHGFQDRPPDTCKLVTRASLCLCATDAFV